MLSRRTFVRALGVAMATVRTPANAFSALEVQFYDDVTRASCKTLLASLNEQHANRMQMARLCDAPPPAIDLRVSSNGGSLHAGLAAYDHIQHLRSFGDVNTHVEGLVASAATLLTVGGTHRTMTKHSMMLFHQPSISVAGEWKATDTRDQLVNMNKCVDALLDVYNATSALSMDELRTLLGNDQMLTARECLECGFVDDLV